MDYNYKNRNYINVPSLHHFCCNNQENQQNFNDTQYNFENALSLKLQFDRDTSIHVYINIISIHNDFLIEIKKFTQFEKHSKE